jgi:succinate dehydrogenase / fumarate reductase cytochrome b subunit
MVVGGFQQWPVSLAYIIAQLFLGLHLWHGAGSWFQSLGLNGRGYDRLIRAFAVVVATVVVVGNCSIPLAILLGYRPQG